jgi:Tol biopolymer transport system component
MKTKKMLAILVLALGLTTKVANADFTFGTPTSLGPIVNSSTGGNGPSISADGLSLYFDSDRPGGYGNADIWVATRETTDDPWGEPENLGPTVNSSQIDWDPCISSEGLELYFRSHRTGGYGGGDIWVAKRKTKKDAWEVPVNLGATVNSSAHADSPSISGDGLELFFTAYNRSGGYGNWDLWVTMRESTADPWTQPVNLGPTVNSSSGDNVPGISFDSRILFFISDRPDGFGGYDLYMTTRATKDKDWGPPVNLGPKVNSSSNDWSPQPSADGRVLFFASERAGGFSNWDMWSAPIIPIVDLNGDGIVDSADVCITVEHWGEYYTLCDIGPTPLGDGIVDVQDLIVLAEHLFEDVNDPTLIAYWPLDEAQGDIAYDNAGTCDGTLLGAPVWQPAGGMVDGAIQLDGVDDCVKTGSIPNPAEGPFSVLAWVKGGAPGQAVLSQMGGPRWFCADPSDGNLMTELKGTGRGAAILLSQSVITDGNWHRIGLVWVGSHRTLYVDGVAVAEDTQTNLEGSANGLYIGAGKAMEAGSFWFGLIDDVRIYNRAVKP